MEKIFLFCENYLTEIVAVLGFIISYLLNKRNLKDEIAKTKMDKSLEKMEDVPVTILSLHDEVMAANKTNNNKSLQQVGNKYKELYNTIFCYGTKEAITIVSAMLENSYQENGDTDKVLIYNILLLCQVKFDFTGVEISPDFWYRMKITNYATRRDVIVEKTNTIVKELELDSFLRIT